MRKAEREVRGNRDEGSGERDGEGEARRPRKKTEGSERGKTDGHPSRTLLGKGLQGKARS